ISTSIRPGARVNQGEAIDVFVSTGAPSVDLPSLMFLADADAATKMSDAGLSCGTSKQQNSPNAPVGQVLAMTIAGGTTHRTAAQKVPAGSTINLVISNGMVQVPDVVGQPISAAQGQLQALQLTVKSVIDQSCGGGNVTSQSGKAEMAQRSTITVTYCGGV